MILRSQIYTIIFKINRANLGMEAMHERNTHNFPLDLAAVDVASGFQVSQSNSYSYPMKQGA